MTKELWDPHLTAWEITSAISESLPKPVHVSTVKRCLNEAIFFGWAYKISANVCNSKKNINIGQFGYGKKVTWIDESKYSRSLNPRAYICEEFCWRTGLGGLHKGFSRTRWRFIDGLGVFWKQPGWKSGRNWGNTVEWGIWKHSGTTCLAKRTAANWMRIHLEKIMTQNTLLRYIAALLLTKSSTDI
jgi:hypothetical protein